MRGEKQLHHYAPAFQNRGRIGSNDHAGLDGSDAGREENLPVFLFHEAYPAGADIFQVRVVTKSRNVNAHLLGQGKDGHPGFSAYRGSVYR